MMKIPSKIKLKPTSTKIHINKIKKRTNCYISRLKISSNYIKKSKANQSLKLRLNLRLRCIYILTISKRIYEFTLKNNKYLHKKILQSDCFRMKLVNK